MILTLSRCREAKGGSLGLLDYPISSNVISMAVDANQRVSYLLSYAVVYCLGTKRNKVPKELIDFLSRFVVGQCEQLTVSLGDLFTYRLGYLTRNFFSSLTVRLELLGYGDGVL